MRTHRYLIGIPIVLTMAVSSLTLPSAQASTPPPAAGPAEADWRAPDTSVEASAAVVLAGVKPDDRPTLVAVYEDDGRLHVERTERSSRADAVREVARRQLESDLIAIEVDASVSTLESVTAQTGDARQAELWGFDRIRATDAWGLSRGAGINVAVIDTGVAPHEDLQGSFGPGIDLVSGGDGRRDGHGHGTHVAGTIAATPGNGVGIAGVAPDVTIMPIRVLGDDGSGSSGAVAEGIIWATDRGADVINMSLGGPTPSTALEKAVQYAIERGVSVIAANGNSGAGAAVSYPAAYDGVVAVAATTTGDARASFSSSNRAADIAAPGARILSTLPGNRYAAWNGTSMATPHVAAVAALIHSYARAKGVNVVVPGLLSSTAADLGSAGWDPEFGHGMVDPVAALLSVNSDDVAPAPPSALRAASTWWSRASVAWELPPAGTPAAGTRVMFADGTPACQVPAPQTSCVIQGLRPETEYVVSAVSLGSLRGSSPSTPVSFRTASRPDFAGDTEATAAKFPAAGVVQELLDDPSDVDWWTFTLPTRVDKPDVRLSQLPSNYDIEVFGFHRGSRYSVWLGNQAGTSDEVMGPRWQYWEPGTYLVKVSRGYLGEPSESRPYRLELLLGGSGALPAPTPTP
ncbi:MAG TPA: hypothetical protein DCQ36_13420, partial [Actinobacteria bacterium]|nr:hypothetical protein [Actinomycetota bacterium]